MAVTVEMLAGMLLKIPEHFCQNCGMPIYDPSLQGTEADGGPSGDFCSNCYQEGAYTYECNLYDMIEGCVPFMTEKIGMNRDEAVSPIGAILHTLKRWKAE